MSDDTRRGFYLGRYNCFERIGSGPLGETFRAKIYGVAGFEKQLAVKRLHTGLCADEEFVARFVNAATAYASLDHERIAKVHEVNVQGAQYYVAVDLVKGIDLWHLLDALTTRGEALARDAAMVIALDAAEALGYAHARSDLLPTGVLHLGLSPQTVIITTDGEVRLLDVGLLGSMVRLGWADDDRLLPALAYLPPEQFRADPLDVRADVFSLGALLHELLGGRRAFPGDSAREVRSHIEGTPPTPPPADARLQALIIHMLQAEPEARVASMSAVREALVPLLGSRTARARQDLGALVRRITRPQLKTGSFAAVAVPSLGPSSPPPPGASGDSKPWAPPKTNTFPTVKLPAPPAPIGPQLSPVPPRNTFAGLGADDQALVLELLELPGSPTERAMPAVTPEILAAHRPPRTDLDAPTTPYEKLPENGAASGSYDLYSVGDSSPTLPAAGALREPGEEMITAPVPLTPPRPQDDAITAPVERSDLPELLRAATPAPTPPLPPADSDGAAPRIPVPAAPPARITAPRLPVSVSTLKGRPAPVFPELKPGGAPPPGVLPAVGVGAPPPRPVEVVTRVETPSARMPEPGAPIELAPLPATGAVAIDGAAPAAGDAVHDLPRDFVTAQSTATSAPAPPTFPLPALVPESAPPVGQRLSTPAPFAPPPLSAQHPPARSGGLVMALVLALVLAGGGAALYFGVFRQRGIEPEPTTPTVATPTVATPTTATPTVALVPEPTPPRPEPTPPARPEATPPARPEPTPPARPEATPPSRPTATTVAGETAVEITSTPAGAAVFVDGAPRGVTPLSLSLRAGDHKLVLLGEGFKMVHKSEKIAGASHPIALTLEPARLPSEIAGSAGLKVRCKTTGELRILVDGADSGRQCPNDVRISVTPGTHKIGLYSPRTGATQELEKDVADAEGSTRVYVKY